MRLNLESSETWPGVGQTLNRMRMDTSFAASTNIRWCMNVTERASLAETTAYDDMRGQPGSQDECYQYVKSGLGSTSTHILVLVVFR